jgi:hypothetical protein
LTRVLSGYAVNQDLSTNASRNRPVRRFADVCPSEHKPGSSEAAIRTETLCEMVQNFTQGTPLLWLLIVGRFFSVIDNDHFNFTFCRFQLQSEPLDCRENIRTVDRRSGHAAGGRE